MEKLNGNKSHIKDAAGTITELHCSYIRESKSGVDSSAIKVKRFAELSLKEVNLTACFQLIIKDIYALKKIQLQII